jgi:hypothetical protein
MLREVMLRLSVFFVSVALWGCGRVHDQSDGRYGLQLGQVVKDECALATDPAIAGAIDLVVSGNSVRMRYTLFDLQLVGFFLKGVESFAADGSIANVNAGVGGRECLYDLVTAHLDGTTVDSQRFDGVLALKLDSRQTGCACELWVTYSAARIP